MEKLERAMPYGTRKILEEKDESSTVYSLMGMNREQFFKSIETN